MTSVAKTASYAADQITDAASNARASLVAFGMHATKLLDAVRGEEIRALDSMLGRFGLQRRQSALRPVLLVVSGAIAAGAIALVLAPSSGKRVREKVRDFLGGIKETRITKTLLQDAKEVGGRVDRVRSGSAASVVGPGNGVDPV